MKPIFYMIILFQFVLIAFLISYNKKRALSFQTTIQNNKEFKRDTLKIKEPDIIAYDSFHPELSKTYDFHTIYTRPNRDHNKEACIQVDLYKKGEKRAVQTILLDTCYHLSNTTFKKDRGRNFVDSTSNQQVVEMDDGDAGDLVIADFNFDQKEDLALMRWSSNIGYLYIFFIQQSNGYFKMDSALTFQMMDFPLILDQSKKQLSIFVRDGALHQIEVVFQFDPKQLKFRNIQKFRHSFDSPDSTKLADMLENCQPNHDDMIYRVLKYNKLQHIYQFGEWHEYQSDATYINYMGNVVTSKGAIYKIVAFKWIWGAGRATSRIYIYDNINQFIGQYCLQNTKEIPYKLEDNKLFFFSNNRRGNYYSGPISTVNLKPGLPKHLIIGNRLVSEFSN